MGKVHVDVQLDVKVGCFLNGFLVGVHFAHMQPLPERQLPQPMRNNRHRPSHLNPLNHLHPTPPLSHLPPPEPLYHIRRQHSLHKEVQPNKNLLSLLWLFITVKDDLCLEIGGLVGEDEGRVTGVEVTDETHDQGEEVGVGYVV